MDTLTLNETKALLAAVDHSRDLAIVTLILNTGLFLNEVAELTVSDIHWESKTITVKGDRARQLPLNEQAFTALARWSQDRVDSSVTEFFTTIKGKLNGLSERSIDHVIRHHAEQAGIDKSVNAHILRNTFAVRLCQEEPDTEQQLKLLGLTDMDALKRYHDVSQSNDDQPNTPGLEALDTRSWSEKMLSKLFPITPKPTKPVSNLEGFLTPNPEEIRFGRDRLVRDIKSHLSHGQSVLVVGTVGLGKTHILHHMKTVFPNCLVVSSPTPIKQLLMAIYTACEPEADLPTKTTTQDLLGKLGQTLPNTRPIVAIDNLHRLRPSDMDTVLAIQTHFTILGAAEVLPGKLNPLWWTFQRIDMDLLDDSHCEELVRYTTQNMAIEDYSMLESRLVALASGNPLAIVEMVKKLSHRPVVTRDAIRDLYHEAGIRYRYWSNAIVVFWAVIVMARFVALGVHSFEGYILAGVGTSFFLMVKGLTRRTR